MLRTLFVWLCYAFIFLARLAFIVHLLWGSCFCCCDFSRLVRWNCLFFTCLCAAWPGCPLVLLIFVCVCCQCDRSGTASTIVNARFTPSVYRSSRVCRTTSEHSSESADQFPRNARAQMVRFPERLSTSWMRLLLLRCLIRAVRTKQIIDYVRI